MYCDKIDLTKFLDKVMDISVVFENSINLPKLTVLYLEDCQLYDYLIERFYAKRPQVYILKSERTHLIDTENFKLENTDSSDDDVLLF